MKSLVKLVVLVMAGLYCLSLLPGVGVLLGQSPGLGLGLGGGVVVPWGGTGFIAPSSYNGGAILSLLVSIVVVALILRWAFGDRRHDRRVESVRAESASTPRPEMEDLARELQHTARRLEERLEALETILLDRSR